MNIHIQNISFSVTPNDLIIHLATDILHSPNYARFSPIPINFHVQLFRDRKGNRIHGGSGTLTLPTADVGLELLREYGPQVNGGLPPKSSIVDRRIIKFSQSSHNVQQKIVDRIVRQPYRDPRAIEEQQHRTHTLQDTVSVDTIQFGWECRDYVYSIEWEEHFRGVCFLSLDDERREIRIRIFKEGIVTIAIRFSQIQNISVHHYSVTDEPIIYIASNMPPTFLKEGRKHERLSALPYNNHEAVAPYTSLALRLICSTKADLRKFRELSNTARLHNIRDFDCPVERRGRFGTAVVETFERWLRALNWCISFQLVALVRSYAVDMREVLDLIPRIAKITQQEGKEYTAGLLCHFSPKVKAMFWDDNSQTVAQCFALAEETYSKTKRAPPIQEESLFESFHVTITPTTMSLEGPFRERSNRVIRSYQREHHESFLRVSFADEGRLSYRFDRDVDGPQFVRRRVGGFLFGGLTIARRKFVFLAYSQSALKEHAVWFVKPFRDSKRGLVDAASIIKSLGTFHNLTFDPKLIYCPAKYAARISQAFTATDATLIDVEEVFQEDDIYTESGEFMFTDGVGTISHSFAREIARELKRNKRRQRKVKEAPALQIRFDGSKGMLSVDYKLKGRCVVLRPSMIKFETLEAGQIEVARVFDKPGQYYLNRPLIMLLEGLGVPYETFEYFQVKAVKEVEEATESLGQAARMIESHGLGSSYRLTSVMVNLARLGIDTLADNQFYQKMLNFSVHHVLRDLKNHARIPIPGAWTLVGVADIHKYLKEDEIFACIKPIDSSSYIYLEGPILISRSPTIHPGDVQVVNAIGRPPPGSCFDKEPLANTVVFSIQGERPLPSCLGGGDLDGDTYNLIPLDNIPGFRVTEVYPPGEYTPAPKKMLDRPSTMEDVAEFVMEYITSDVLGIIAINWLIIADQSNEGIFDKDCLTLANLHSDAVDFQKSGQPVALDAIPRLKQNTKPDWNAPETIKPDNDKFYPSQRAIGRLYRGIDLPDLKSGARLSRIERQKLAEGRDVDDLAENLSSFGLVENEDEVLMAIQDEVSRYIPTLNDRPPQDKTHNIASIFSRYSSELLGICAAHSLSYAQTALLSEAEVVVGTIVDKCSQPRRRKDTMAKLRERTDVLVKEIREDLSGHEDLDLEEVLENGWLAWKLSLVAEEKKVGSRRSAEDRNFGAHSFGWIALGFIFDTIKSIEDRNDENIRSRYD